MYIYMYLYLCLYLYVCICKSYPCSMYGGNLQQLAAATTQLASDRPAVEALLTRLFGTLAHGDTYGDRWVEYSAVRHGAVRYSTVHNVQYDAARCGAV